MSLDYREYLSRAEALLLSEGARQILSSGAGNPVPAWAEGWDSILLSEGPGSRNMYAFTDIDTGGPFQERFDRLAEGIARSGILSGPPMNLVAVAVSSRGVDGNMKQRVVRSAPTIYYAGMKPSAWLADLPGDRVVTSRFNRAAERGILQTAIRQAREGELVDAHGVSIQQRENIRRTEAFYTLMQGRQPIVTYSLIVINAAIYLLLYTRGGPDNEIALRDMGALSPILIEHGQWWRLFTSIFLHAGVAHILFNMTSLFAVGALAERLYGSARFLAIYLGSGLIGSLTSFTYAVVSGNTNVLGVGASGAIFGVAGALLTVRYQRSDVIPKRLRDRISTSLLPLVAISLIFAFLTPHVDNSAHIGGLVGGMLLSFLFPLVKTVPVQSSGERRPT